MRSRIIQEEHKNLYFRITKDKNGAKKGDMYVIVREVNNNDNSLWSDGGQ